MLTVQSIIEQTYEKWSAAVSEKVGDNCSMENSETVSSLPYSSLYFMGASTSTVTLEGNEGAITSSLQVDIYTTGQTALTQIYEIDQLSHESLTSMYYKRSSGPELIQSTDPSIKRLTSRYTRVWGLDDAFPE